MSELADLRSKGESITLSNGLVMNILPMSIDEEVDMAEYQKNEEYIKAISHLVKMAVKRAIPKATDEEINLLNKDDLKLITETVLKVNKLKTGEEKNLNTQPVSKKEQSWVSGRRM